METFSFDQLKTAYVVEITPELQQAIQEGARKAFPDDAGTSFNVVRVIASEGSRFVEVTPDKDTGYERYIFELDSKDKLARAYALEDHQFVLHFSG